MLVNACQRAVQPSSSGSTVCVERQRLAGSKDWVEGLRAAADTVRQEGNITLAKALDITHFQVYESYLDKDYTNNRAKRLMIKTKHW